MPMNVYAYECRLKNMPRLNKNLHRWVTLRDMKHYPFPSGSAKIIKHMEQSEKILGEKDKKINGCHLSVR